MNNLIDISWAALGSELLWGALSTIKNLLIVIVPLMVLIEFLLAYKVVDKFAVKMGWFAKLLGIGKEALLPLFVGLLLGITYGAGTIAALNKDNPLPQKDFRLIGIFLFACHGIIETTYLFAVNGASIFYVCILRLLIATAVTAIASRLPNRSVYKNPE